MRFILITFFVLIIKGTTIAQSIDLGNGFQFSLLNEYTEKNLLPETYQIDSASLIVEVAFHNNMYTRQRENCVFLLHMEDINNYQVIDSDGNNLQLSKHRYFSIDYYYIDLSSSVSITIFKNDIRVLTLKKSNWEIKAAVFDLNEKPLKEISLFELKNHQYKSGITITNGFDTLKYITSTFVYIDWTHNLPFAYSDYESLTDGDTLFMGIYSFTSTYALPTSNFETAFSDPIIFRNNPVTALLTSPHPLDEKLRYTEIYSLSGQLLGNYDAGEKLPENYTSPVIVKHIYENRVESRLVR